MNYLQGQVMCPTCHTTLAMSDSPAAQRIRVFVAKRIAACWTAEQIESALVANYGQGILAAPSYKGFDLLAWWLPILGVLAGAIVLAFAVWKGGGVFGRLGWNNGKTESFAFTALDSLATGGVSVNGARWKRPDDTVAAEVTTAGISGVHATYLSRGGLDFLIGDGALHYGRETIAEAYYSARLAPWFFTAIDLQHITNPAYNRDRGPVWVLSLRLHTEFGKK